MNIINDIKCGPACISDDELWLRKLVIASNNKEKAKSTMDNETKNELTIVIMEYPFVYCSSGPIVE